MKNKIRKIVREILNESYGMFEPLFSPSALDGMSNEKARRFVSKIAKNAYHTGIYKDESWVGANSIKKAFNEANIGYEIISSDYVNWSSQERGVSSRKEWKLRFPFINNNGKETLLHGTITAAGDGSVEDPLEKYDMKFTVFEESTDVKQMYKKAGMAPPKQEKGIHTKKFHKCVTSVGKDGGVDNPYAVCMASLGKDKAVKKPHQKESYIEDTQECVIDGFDTKYNYKDSDISEICEILSEDSLGEAEYKGRKVQLNKVMRGNTKKFKVYVKNDKGNVVKVNFGHGGESAKKQGYKRGMSIKKNTNPKARKSFRARHNCDDPGPKWKARYWACKTW